jgi:hypothetical protein
VKSFTIAELSNPSQHRTNQTSHKPMTNLPKRTKSDPRIDRKFEFSIDKSVWTNQTLETTGRKKNGNRAERRSASSRPPFYRLDVPLQKIPHLTRLCFFQERRIAPHHTRETTQTRPSKVSRASRQEKEQGLFSVVDHIAEKTAYTLLRTTSRVNNVSANSSFFLRVHTKHTCMMHM